MSGAVGLEEKRYRVETVDFPFRYNSLNLLGASPSWVTMHPMSMPTRRSAGEPSSL